MKSRRLLISSKVVVEMEGCQLPNFVVVETKVHSTGDPKRQLQERTLNLPVERPVHIAETNGAHMIHDSNDSISL
jgi:hypothetical protein